MMLSLLIAATAAATTPANAPATTPAAKPDIARIPAQNPFDAKKQPWLPPSTASTPALTDEDLRIHGVILAGSTRKAIVELLAPRLIEPGPKGKPGRPYRVVSVGDEIGGYRIADITPTQLVFAQGNGQAALPFTIAKGRPSAGGAVAAPEQVAIITASPMPTMLEGVEPPQVDSPPPPAPTATPLNPDPAPQLNNAAATPVTNASDGQSASNGPPPAGMSLLEAIQYAKAHAANNQNQAPSNPFTNPPGGSGK